MQTLLPFIATLHPGAQDLFDLMRYFAFVVVEGDWANDWLTHLPSDLAPHVMVIGEWMAGILF
jgi:hypothetical protein